MTIAITEQKISFQSDLDQKNRLGQLIPWGMRSEFLRQVVNFALDAIERGGYPMIGALMHGNFEIVVKDLKTGKE